MLLTTTLTFLMARADGIVPNNGYCLGNQCFAAFQDPSDFTTAQNHCAKKGGHLMTVRSSVSHDTLLILLGSLYEEYWVGLHLPSGCPDAAAALRGFQWVTGDSESDFYNWAAFDSSCSSKCVSLSKDDDFKWTQQSCDKITPGFLCEYSFENPCKGLIVSGGETVHYWIHYGFEGEDVLSLPPGSTAVHRPSETKYICSFGRWMKAPWTCEIYEGGCEHQCVEDHQYHEPVCFCPPGQVVNPNNNVTCEAVKDDPCVHLRCEQACYQRNDSYACMCDHGFELAEDGRTCKDINDCADERQCPGDNYKCKNTIGGFQCVCQDGYKLVNDNCVDIDECANAPCEHICSNTPGGYECSCFDGYVVIPETPNTCELYCGRGECPAECDPNDKFQCNCPMGYISEERGEDTFCLDIDECEMYACDQDCKNTYGSYVCSCSAGFTLVSGYKCEKNEVDKDKDTDADGWEGSGVTTPYLIITPSVKYTEPTSRPSSVTAGGLLGIIVCVVVVILVMVFLAHHILKRRGKFESVRAHKAQEDEVHDLQQVTTEKYEKTSEERHLKQDT